MARTSREKHTGWRSSAVTMGASALVVLGSLGAIARAQESPHSGLAWTGPATCLECHSSEAREVHGSVMYQWQGEAPQMASGPATQGKIAGAVNSYCVNITGNWGGCGACHLGLGALPEEQESPEQLANIDCLLCHQKDYRRVRSGDVLVPDTLAMPISMDVAVQTVHLPQRWNCLQCHAKAGGGDAVKRGDLSLAHASTTDREFDVHMATTGADLACQSCHTFTAHRVAGRGSDLRPSDSDVVPECATCHPGKDTASGHANPDIGRHVGRVACQTCHIPIYAKNAADTVATEATEIHRTWLETHSSSVPFHPVSMLQNDLTPEYRFWNRTSRNALLGEVVPIDQQTGRYPTSRPLGWVGDPTSKLYPFKYKTALQPMVNRTGQLVPLDTSVFFATADAAAATEQGLVNMGLEATEGYSWVETDTYQLLNHEVSPASFALDCGSCHGSSARMNLVDDLGYGLKSDAQQVCVQCHGPKDPMEFTRLHKKHVQDKRLDCSWCHGFTRPELTLGVPLRNIIFSDGFEIGGVAAWNG